MLIKYPTITLTNVRIVNVPEFLTINNDRIMQFAEIAANEPDKNRLVINFYVENVPEPLKQ